jgi:aldehyde dehydrogenase (NAD+)
VRSVFNTGRTRDLKWREQQLRAIERMCDEREAEISAALTADLGRSAFESWLVDVASTKAEAAFARKHLRKWTKPKRAGLPLAQMPGKAWVQFDPLGVVLIIGPWNYPFFLCMSPLVAAVAAGDAAVIKPSELAPATSVLIAKLVPQYLDRDAIRVVEGAADVTQDLLSQGFDHALFTGGTEIGRKIMAAAAPTLTPVTLELGGKSPALIAPGFDLALAAERIATGKLFNAGQTCVAPDYVLVPEAQREAFIDLFFAAVAKRLPTLEAPCAAGPEEAHGAEEERKRAAAALCPQHTDLPAGWSACCHRGPGCRRRAALCRVESALREEAPVQRALSRPRLSRL